MFSYLVLINDIVCSAGLQEYENVLGWPGYLCSNPLSFLHKQMVMFMIAKCANVSLSLREQVKLFT